MEYEQSIGAYVCRYCKGSFDHLENLQKHVQQIHTARSSSKDKICPLCGLKCVKIETYRDHLKHIHRQNEEGNAFILKCFNDFLVWKNELEKRNYCKYIMQGNPKNLRTSHDKLHVYRCDSSTPTTRERKSACTAKDSCPSMISAIESSKNHSVRVEYWNTHVGHSIPVLGDELDAAIDSLQTTEIIVEDQTYQTFEQDADGNIYFLTESNDGSISETYAKEVHKKQPPSLFHNDGDSSSSQTLKTAPRKFSFKKDPTKKSVSFSGSLASVACMKASAKKEPVTPSTTLTTTTTTTSSSSSKIDTSTPVSVSKTSESPSKVKNDANKTSSVSSAKKSQNKGGQVTVPTTQANVPSLLTKNFFPIAPATSSSQLKIDNGPSLPNFSITANEGNLNGQFILLNSLEGQNGQQNLILCPVGANLPSGSQTTVRTGTTEQKNVGKKSTKGPKKTNKSDLPPSVQNVFTLASNVPCPEGVARTFLQSGPSILKKSTTLENTPKLPKPSPAGTQKAEKNTTLQNTLSIGKKLSLLNAASNEANKKKVPTTIAPNIKGIITVNSPVKGSNSKSSPVAVNQLLSNSLPAGVSYIQINNNLIPINRPAEIGGLTLNSRFILSSPISPTQNAQSLLNLSSVKQASSPMALSNKANSPASVMVKTPTNGKNTVAKDNHPVIVISQLGNNGTSTTVPSLSSVLTSKSINSLPQAVASSPVSTRSAKPLAGRSILSSIKLPGDTSIRPSLIPNTSKFIPSPLTQILTSTQTSSMPALSTLLGETSNISTTMSSTLLVQNVALSSSVANTTTSNKQNVGSTSKPFAVNSVVLNTGSISSTPVINIPSNPRAHPQKPGAFIFESSGDLYVLEPIDQKKATKSDISVENVKETNNSLAADKIENNPFQSGDEKQSATAENLHDTPSDTECVMLDDNHADDDSESDSIASENTSEKACPKSPIKEIKKLKRIKRYPTIAKGKQIASAPQKRRFTEDDAEILKKVKYYHLEMKYLSSQAECKRLKVELAKAQMRNKEDLSNPMEVDIIPEDNDSSSKKSDVEPNLDVIPPEDPLLNTDELVIDPFPSTTKKDGRHNELKTENSKNDKLEDQFPVDVSKAEEEIVETPQALEKGNEGVAAFNIEIKDKEFEVKEVDTCNIEVKEVDTCNIKDKEVGTCNIEFEDKEMRVCNIEIKDGESVNFETSENQTVNEVEDRLTYEVFQSKPVIGDSDNSLNIENNVPMDYEIVSTEMVTDAVVDKLDQVEYHEVEETKPEEMDDQSIGIHAMEEDSENLEEMIQRQAMAINDFGRFINEMGEVEIFENAKSSEKQSEILNHCEKDKVAKEILQELEIQYGDKSTDIYTMIRTSVLQSLYANMQELCQENKKMFEELQKLKNAESPQVEEL